MTRVSWVLGVLLCGLLSLSFHGRAAAQSIVVLVNDAPITSYDLTQRQRFLALTSGLGDRMRARLESAETKQAFQAFMTREQPASQEEAQELQRKFVKQLQQKVVADSSSVKRKEALDQLIEERLMMQAAEEQKITISDSEVEEMLTRMAQGGSQKLSLKEFLAQFSNQGINPATLQNRIRAQTAWRQVIRQVYGSRVQSSVSVTASTATNTEDGTVVDVHTVKLAVPAGASQQLTAKRLVEAQNIGKRFKNCAGLAGLLKGVKDVSVASHAKARITKFSGAVRAAILKGQEGQMTPPVIVAGGVESHAICSKRVPVASGESKKKDDAQDKLQEAFQLYSRRHLKDLRDHARLDYPKSR